MLFRRIERLRDRMIIRLTRPVRCEYLIGPAPEHQLAILAVETGRRDIRVCDPIAEHPAAKRKAPSGIFFRSAGCLHDAVKRRKR